MSKRSGLDLKSIIEPGKKQRTGVVTRAMSKSKPLQGVVQESQAPVQLRSVKLKKKEKKKILPKVDIHQSQINTRRSGKGELMGELKIFRKARRSNKKAEERMVQPAEWVPEDDLPHAEEQIPHQVEEEEKKEEEKKDDYVDDGQFPEISDREFIKRWRQNFQIPIKVYPGESADQGKMRQSFEFTDSDKIKATKGDGYFMSGQLDPSWNNLVNNFRDENQLTRIEQRLQFQDTNVFRGVTQHGREIVQELAGVDTLTTGDPLLPLISGGALDLVMDEEVQESFAVHLSAYDPPERKRLEQKIQTLFPGFVYENPDYIQISLLNFNMNDTESQPSDQIRNLTLKLAFCIAMSPRFKSLMSHPFNPTPIGGAEISSEQFEVYMQQDLLLSQQINNYELQLQNNSITLENIPQLFENDALRNILLDITSEDQFIQRWTNYFNDQSDKFFRQMFVLIFEGSALDIMKGYTLSSQKDVRFETLFNPEAQDELFEDNVETTRFRDEFTLTDENDNLLFESMESVAHRLSISRLNVIVIMKLVADFLRIHIFFMRNNPLIARDLCRMFMLFLPHSFKSLSNNMDAEMTDASVRPHLAWTAFNLMKLSSMVFRLAIFLDKSGQPRLDSQIKQGANIPHQRITDVFDFEVPQNLQIPEIESISRKFLFSSSINRLVFEIREKNVNAPGLQHFPRYSENFRPFTLDQQKNVLMFNKESFRKSDVQQNKFLVQKIWNLIFNQRDAFGVNNDLFLRHYVDLVISFFINPQHGDEEMEREAVLNKQYRTFSFQLQDRGFITEQQKIDQIRTNLQDQFEYFIGENLDHYADDADISALDPSSISVESLHVVTLRNDDITQSIKYLREQRVFQQIDNPYERNDRQYVYKFFSITGGEAKFTKFAAHFRGDIELDIDYINSRIPQYKDTPDFTCCFNVGFYLWNFFVSEWIVVDNLESRFLFTKSDFYTTIKQSIFDGNIGQLFLQVRPLIKEKATLVFYCPQSQIISFEGELIPEQCVWIILKNSHCWIGDGFKLMEIHGSKKEMQPHVYKLPSRKFSKCKNQDEKKNQQIKVFYDIETIKNNKGEIMLPILLCYQSMFDDDCDKGYFFGTQCVQHFVEYLDTLETKINKKESSGKKTRQRKIFVYAHNGAKFDHLFLQKWIMFFHLQSYKLIGSTHDIKFASFKANIVLRDSNLLFPGRLKDLANEFQTDHRKLDFDTPDITMEKIENEIGFKEKLIEYCEMDVQVLKEVYFKFLSSLQIAIPGFSELDIKQTLPATALHAFDKFFIKDTIYGNFPLQIGMRVQGLERLSYFGGVTQVFNHQKGENLCYYDFVSMYVSIMIQDYFPLSQGQYEAYSGEVQEGKLYSVVQFSFSPSTLISNIPLKNHKTQVTIYPLEYKQGDAGVNFLMVWGREIKLAYKLGLSSIKITGQIRYEQWGNIFKNYMTTFFNLKKNSSPSVAKISKLMGNSLYGKFGQKNEGSRFFINKGEADVLGAEGLSRLCQEKMIQRGINAKLQQNDSQQIIDAVHKISQNVYEVIQCPNERDLHTPGAFIRLASYITMCGRCRIFDVILKIGVRDVFYCDTDSVVLRMSAQSRVTNIGKEVGCIADALKGATIKEGYFAAAKCYGLVLDKPYDNKMEYVRFKGVKNPTVEMVKELKRTGKITKKQDFWKRRFDGVGIEEVHKKILLATKRMVNPDGTTRPFTNYKHFEQYENKTLTNEDGVNFIYKNF